MTRAGRAGLVVVGLLLLVATSVTLIRQTRDDGHLQVSGSLATSTSNVASPADVQDFRPGGINGRVLGPDGVQRGGTIVALEGPLRRAIDTAADGTFADHSSTGSLLAVGEHTRRIDEARLMRRRCQHELGRRASSGVGARVGLVARDRQCRTARSRSTANER